MSAANSTLPDIAAHIEGALSLLQAVRVYIRDDDADLIYAGEMLTFLHDQLFDDITRLRKGLDAEEQR